MDITKVSDNALKSFHLSVRKAAEADAVNPDQREPYYGVVEYSDWATHRDELEAELSNRNIPFISIHW